MAKTLTTVAVETFGWPQAARDRRSRLARIDLIVQPRRKTWRALRRPNGTPAKITLGRRRHRPEMPGEPVVVSSSRSRRLDGWPPTSSPAAMARTSPPTPSPPSAASASPRGPRRQRLRQGGRRLRGSRQDQATKLVDVGRRSDRRGLKGSPAPCRSLARQAGCRDRRHDIFSVVEDVAIAVSPVASAEQRHHRCPGPVFHARCRPCQLAPVPPRIETNPVAGMLPRTEQRHATASLATPRSSSYGARRRGRRAVGAIFSCCCSPGAALTRLPNEVEELPTAPPSTCQPSG